MKTTDCGKVLRILKDRKPHRNFDVIDIFGGGFALAARIWDLRNPKGRYKLNIKCGYPKDFNRKRISKGDYYYQLKKLGTESERYGRSPVASGIPVIKAANREIIANIMKERRTIEPDHIYQGHVLEVLRTFPDGKKGQMEMFA